MLLVGDEEKIKIKIPLILSPSGSKEGDILDIAIARCVGDRGCKRKSIKLDEKLINKNKY